MKELIVIGFLTAGFVYTAGHYGMWEDFKERAEVVHKYEYKALSLAQKVRLLEKENNSLKTQIRELKAQKEYLSMTKAKKKARKIASIGKTKVNDLVNYDVYKWSPEKLLGVGEKELHFKNYDKSAQFLNTLVNEFPNHKSVDDKVLFQAGIAAYESKKYYKWAEDHFHKIVKKYPRSKYYRGAKLWLALSQFHQGDLKHFMSTVDEFKLKYRNTKEWKVLSRYYEDIAYKYKNKKQVQ